MLRTLSSGSFSSPKVCRLNEPYNSSSRSFSPSCEPQPSITEVRCVTQACRNCQRKYVRSVSCSGGSPMDGFCNKDCLASFKVSGRMVVEEQRDAQFWQRRYDERRLQVLTEQEVLEGKTAVSETETNSFSEDGVFESPDPVVAKPPPVSPQPGQRTSFLKSLFRRGKA